MQDEFHAEDQPEVTPDEPTTELNEPNEAADEAPSAARPAATASSYRDIIAERLARKGGGKVSGSTPSPIAHSSDVERAQWPEASPTMQGSPTILPANIEAITKRQE